MPKYTYYLRPLEHAMVTAYPSLNIAGLFSPNTINIKPDQHSIVKRWGYLLDRTLVSGVSATNIVLFQKSNGNKYTIYLTGTDAIKRDVGAGLTWSYITDTHHAGAVASIAGAVVTGTGTTWTTAGLAPGDKFIVDFDHVIDVEPSAFWATIQSIDNDTQITLTSNYAGAGTGAYKIRKVYATPTSERWATAMVEDKFFFTNGSTDVMSWDETGYATAVDSANASRAKYCIEFANRLCLADLINYSSGVRDPYLFQYSAEGDPTDWTSYNAGQIAFLETDDFITGIGKVGPNIIVYKQNSIYIGEATGDATTPIIFPRYRRGIGNNAPYSLVEFMGTNAFIGNDDFYYINGEQPDPISTDKMRFKFFDVVNTEEVKHTWGVANYDAHEIMWTATTTTGKYQFVWDWKTDEWYLYKFTDSIVGMGRGTK
jgi:hypothetical protein